jgi:dienelactone hydrolase
MDRTVKFVAAIAALSVAFCATARAEQVTLDLPTGETLAAELQLPKQGNPGAKKFPAIIYLHGAMVREEGADGAAKLRYDVMDFAHAFANAGFVAMVPIRKTPAGDGNGDDAVDEGLSVVLGAMDYLRGRKDVNPRLVSVVGFGEGGMIGLWALSQMPDIAKGVIMSPDALHKGRHRAATLNLNKFVANRAAQSIHAPVLLTVGEKENRASLRAATTVSQALMKAYRKFWFIRNYPGRHRWFHQPRDAFMSDVIAFLKR